MTIKEYREMNEGNRYEEKTEGIYAWIEKDGVKIANLHGHLRAFSLNSKIEVRFIDNYGRN